MAEKGAKEQEEQDRRRGTGGNEVLGVWWREAGADLGVICTEMIVEEMRVSEIAEGSLNTSTAQ